MYASAGCTVAEKTFDGAEATTEEAPVSLWLDSPYQISKIIGEYYSNYYFTRHGLPTVKARFQNVYGPGEVLGAGRWRGTVNTVWRNVVPTFIYKALHQEALPIENGGIATRDFIYVGDMAQGLIACATQGEAGEVYNLASGRETSIRELAELINELTGNPTPIELAPARDWDHSGQRYGATEKARDTIGFEARTELRDGLERTIEWTREKWAGSSAASASHGDRMRELKLPAWADVLRTAPRVIKPPPGFARRSCASCGTSGICMYLLARREVSVRYKQSAIGVSWAVVQPILLAVVFSVFFGHLAKVPSERECRIRRSPSRGWCCGCSSLAR